MTLSACNRQRHCNVPLWRGLFLASERVRTQPESEACIRGAGHGRVSGTRARLGWASLCGVPAESACEQQPRTFHVCQRAEASEP